MPSAFSDQDVDVSVVVPTRDRAAWLGSCLDALTRQRTTTPYEVVVVDNGSTDDTQATVNRWRVNDARIRLIQEPTVGLSRAKNAGIRSARGRLILMTDDDVIVSESWIAAHLACLESNGGARSLVGGPVLPVAADLSEWPAWISQRATADLPRLYLGPQQRVLEEFEWLWGANMAMSKDLIDQVGFFDEDIGRSGDQRGTFEDVDFGERVRQAGGQLVYCPAAIVHHRTPVAAAQPRTVVSKAFNRGANDFLRSQRNAYYEMQLRLPRSTFAATLALPCTLAIWALSTAAFYLTRTPLSLELGRRFAWATGWCMAVCSRTAVSGSGSPGARLALLGRRVMLRATPHLRSEG
jgi:GT2 family glycosyltransferase